VFSISIILANVEFVLVAVVNVVVVVVVVVVVLVFDGRDFLVSPRRVFKLALCLDILAALSPDGDNPCGCAQAGCRACRTG
jgi:hypothetical protein